MIFLLLATRNRHKTRELQQILGPGFDLQDLPAYPKIPETTESGKTFEENAVLKAVAASQKHSGIVIADDSGLEVDALAGAPGIYSARYAGEGASDEQNIVKLLEALAQTDAPPEQRRARFRCVIAAAGDGKLLETFDGVVEGQIVARPHGSNGFGYDPIFVPDGFNETFAELPDEIKNRISHRARAVHKLRQYLTSHLSTLNR